MDENRHPARYYDGERATGRDACFGIRNGTLEIFDTAGTRLAQWPLAAVKLRGNLRDDAAVIAESILTPAGRLRIEDAHAAEALTARLPRTARTDRFQPRRVAGWTAVGLAVAGLLALGVHFLPHYAAPLLPFETKRSLGRATFDRWFAVEPICYALEGFGPLKRLARRLRDAAGIDHSLQVLVIDTSMVNAFALPGGYVVLTSGLIAHAEDPDEVAGVLAHELGHVKSDDPTVGMLRSMGITALLQLLSGGVAMETIASTVGTLAFLSYSRAAEENADAAAVEMLERAGIHPDGLSRFFARLQKEEGGSGSVGWVADWFSTHPPTEARRAATERNAAGAPALSAEDWAGLRAICTPWSED